MEVSPTSSLSPTRLAIYHQNHCDWYLHQSFHRLAAIPAQGTATAPSSDPSEVTAPAITTAHFQRGIEWEARLFDYLERQGQLLRLPPKALTQEQIPDIIIESVSVKNICYISNLVFQSPSFEEELAEFHSAPFPHRLFGIAKPDLIQVNRLETGEITWEVIDAKSSTSVKTSHHAQIGFYHLALEKLLAPVKSRPGGPTLVPSEFASIWLSPPDGINNPEDSSGPISTPLSLLLPPLKIFLFKTLPKVLSLPPRRVEWLLNPLCRGCEFEEKCTATTNAEKRLGGIPNLSISEARFIREVMAIYKGPEKKSELEDLEDIIGGPRLKRINESYGSTGKKFQRLLDVRVVDGTPRSTLLEAAISGRPKLIQRRVLTFPREEDISIFVSIVIDIGTNTLAKFCTSSFASTGPFAPPIVGSAQEFIPLMSDLLRRIQTEHPTGRTQIYTYSPAEKGAIISHLINVAVSDTSSSGDIRLCLGTLCDGASLLLTDYQPLVLSGVLLSLLSKKNSLKLQQLRTCCQRLNLDDTGTVDVLRARIEAEQKRLAGAAELASSAPRRRQVGQLGKIVVLKQEIQRLIALPIPGYTDLPQIAKVLLFGANIGCASDDELFAAWSSHDEAKLKVSLEARNRCMRALVRNIRDRITLSGPVEKILLNDARPLEKNGMMDPCRSKPLRKLSFMLQFEVLVRLHELWNDRLEGCPNAPLLRYNRSQKQANGKWEHLFTIVSGTLEPRLDDRSYYDWILVPENGETAPKDEGVAPEIFFDDLLLCSLVFPLTRWTKDKWEQQHPLIREKCFVANVAEIHVVSHANDNIDPKDELVSQAVVQTFGTYVDFNLARTLLNLVTLDFMEDTTSDVPFISLITDPQVFAISPTFGGGKALDAEATINQRFNELASLGVSHAAALTLKSSQRRAARRVIGSRLSVIWGPPGTGKTYTLTLSILRLLEALHMTNTPGECKSVLVTAMTHAAIDCLIDKLHTLTDHYRAMKDLETTWLASVVMERVRIGTNHPYAKEDNGKIHIYAGTAYQLYKFCNKNGITADVVVIDEAGQLGLGTAALVIRFLSDRGKLVLAGDHQQLAPILGTSYPESEGTPPLFGSVLDTLMSGRRELRRAPLGAGRSRADSTDSQMTEGTDSTVVQLLENWRLNADLGEFVELIYSRRFKPMKSHADDLARELRLWLDSTVSDDMVKEQARRFLLSLASAMDTKSPRSTDLRPPRVPPTGQVAKGDGSQLTSLALIRTRFSASHLPYESHVEAEARLAAALVLLLQDTFGVDKSIFVATPHRIQRTAVRQALKLSGQTIAQGPAPDGEQDEMDNLTELMGGLKASHNNLRIDTVERLQGAEASFVIFLLSHTHTQSLSNHVGFLLTRRRLNVGISRAKSLCIVISSREVLNPGIEVLANADTRDGLEFLRAYEDRAWSGDIDLNV